MLIIMYSNEAKHWVFKSFTLKLLCKMTATPPPRRPVLGTCVKVKPLGQISPMYFWSSSVPVNQVSVSAKISNLLSTMKSFISSVLFLADRQLRRAKFTFSVSGVVVWLCIGPMVVVRSGIGAYGYLFLSSNNRWSEYHLFTCTSTATPSWAKRYPCIAGQSPCCMVK